MAIILNSATECLTLQLGVYDEDSTNFVRTTEKQTVEYDNKCSNFGYYVTWLNSLGGWEYWFFKGEKDYKLDIDEDIIATKNRFENWDNDFINEETGSFFSSIRAYEEKEIRSGQLTASQADAIAKIKHAIQVQEVREDDTKFTILVDKGNIVVRRDRDFFAEIAFNIRATDEIAIQEQ